MTALIQIHPVRKEFLQTTNIPFLDSSQDAFSTCVQEDFQPVSSRKAEPVSQPTPAQVDHKDLRYIKEYLTEAMVSYQHHPLPQMTRIPRWAALNTNFKMQTDPREVSFLTTHSERFQPLPFQPIPIRQTLATTSNQHVEKLPESTSKACFTPQHGSPFIKATVRHLEEGFPTIKGDGRHCSFISQYKNTFQGAWSRAVKPVEKHTSSVALGDPVKIVERETTHAASFSRPSVCSRPVVKDRLKLCLRNCSHDSSWLSTSKEDFCYKKPREPIVRAQRNQASSSLPVGDADPGRNRERMSVTTNRVFYSDLDRTERPVIVSGSDLMTKSHVRFSPACLSGLYYTTTAKEHYSNQDGVPARPAIQQPSNILSGPEHGGSLSVTMTDFLPLKSCRQTPYLTHQRSNVRFPLADQQFSTTHSEDYTPKALILQHAVCSQFFSHFKMQ